LTIRTLTLAVALLSAVGAVAEQNYTVLRGDTLGKISKRLGVSEDALSSENNLTKSAHLKRGQSLVIPSSKDNADSASKSIGTAQVILDQAVPHAGPFAGARSLDPINVGVVLPALDTKPGWVNVQLTKGQAWLPSDIVIFKPAPAAQPVVLTCAPRKSTKEESVATVVKNARALGNPLLNKALTYQGVRYRWGGTSRSSGVDCSGFTTSVFLSQGIKLPRTAIQQSQIGTGVGKTNLKPGDLVFFRTSRSYRVNHVGIYVGEGKFIHAATGAGHVMVSSLGDKYYLRCYATARRVADFATASRAAAASRAATDEPAAN